MLLCADWQLYKRSGTFERLLTSSATWVINETEALKRFCVALPFFYTSPFSRAPKSSIIAKLYRAIRPGHGRFHPQTGNKPSFIQKKIKCLSNQKQAARFVGSSMVTGQGFPYPSAATARCGRWWFQRRRHLVGNTEIYFSTIAERLHGELEGYNPGETELPRLSQQQYVDTVTKILIRLYSVHWQLGWTPLVRHQKGLF